jgi:hypothetical protein
MPRVRNTHREKIDIYQRMQGALLLYLTTGKQVVIQPDINQLTVS